MRINLMQSHVTARPTVRRTPPARAATRPTGTRAVILATLAVALAVAGAIAATQIAGQQGSVSQAPPPAHALPGTLTGSERAAVTAALRSPDAHTRRLAISVAAGEAGSLALADPSTLHHHGVNTAAAPERDHPRSSERFHHHR
jgi:hypothetical protein